LTNCINSHGNVFLSLLNSRSPAMLKLWHGGPPETTSASLMLSSIDGLDLSTWFSSFMLPIINLWRIESKLFTSEKECMLLRSGYSLGSSRNLNDILSKEYILESQTV